MMQSSGETRRENNGSWIRHCEEPTGPREARPDDRLRDEAIQSRARGSGLLRFARNDSGELRVAAQRAGVAPQTSPEELRDRVAATQWTPEYK